MILRTSTKAPNIDFCYKPYIPWILLMHLFKPNKGNNKITELRTILQRESQNS